MQLAPRTTGYEDIHVMLRPAPLQAWELQTSWDLYYLIFTPNLDNQLDLTKQESTLMSKMLKKKKVVPPC